MDSYVKLNLQTCRCKYMNSLSSIYYLPGRAGEIRTGLGEGLTSRGLSVFGRETRDAFADLQFSEQVQVVARDIEQYFWAPSARLVAVSYGCYLFLHAQMLLPPYIGKVLLLSPIIGEFSSPDRGIGFFPPRSSKLLEKISSGVYPAPRNCEVHVGADDWQADPEGVKKFFDALQIPVTIASARGHMLGRDYVGPLLDRWLQQDNIQN